MIRFTHLLRKANQRLRIRHATILTLFIAGAAIGAKTASAEVIIYKLNSLERHIGAGQDFRLPVRGVMVIDLSTFQAELIGITRVANRKFMARESIQEADFRVVRGLNGRTSTLWAQSFPDDDNDANTFDVMYARGTDAFVDIAPGFQDWWPKKWPFVWVTAGYEDGFVRCHESGGNFTFDGPQTFSANEAGLSFESVVAIIAASYRQQGYFEP